VLTKDDICTLVDVVIYYPNLAQLKMQLKPRKGAITTDTPLINSSLSNWSILLFTQTYRCVFEWLCQCHLELEGDKRPSSFYLGHFSLSKSFDHIIKDANAFHFKLSDRRKLNYFLTFTPSRHTSHHHGRPIASCWFLTCKYQRPSTNSRLWTYIDFHSNFEATWHLVISPFSFILLLCTFP
jgi:hypothetical protein